MKISLFTLLKFTTGFVMSILLLLSCASGPRPAARVAGGNIRIDFDKSLNSRVAAVFNNNVSYLSDNYLPSEFVTITGNTMNDFTFTGKSMEKVDDKIGSGKKFVINAKGTLLSKQVSVTVYDDFPTMAFFAVKYENTGNQELTINSWTNNQYAIQSTADSNAVPAFWSYQSGSYEERPDWVLPLKTGFSQQNYMGMNATDYGGGTPVSDVWRRDAGVAVGHVEMVPKLVSLPVTMPDQSQALLSVTYQVDKKLLPGESLITLNTFVNVHQGDYFASLTEYRRFMVKQGIEFQEPPAAAYEPIWCAWGYERKFTMEQIYGTFPMVKKLGYGWVVLDDGWQTSEGDWYLDKNKYPAGDRDMIKFVEKIHANGFKAKLWWAPLAVDPGTDLIKNHEDYVLLNKDGSRQDISWWDSYYLCPAYPSVQEYTKELVKKIIGEWGYDGLKIDGQHLNAVPPCYNPAHNHAYPEEAVEKVPEFFKMIFETARSIKPDVVIEICPCGTAYSFFTMPYMTQPVGSDPTSSWQIRLKGKTLKALMGSTVPYFGDHVELSDGQNDFASALGIGAVIGTKFTWPVGAKKNSRIDLTPEKEQEWDKWIKIYRNKMLPTGTYLGTLYDIGFDKPETHVIAKDQVMNYAFFAPHWQGDVELRGLENKGYQLYDYVNDKDYGTVQGPVAKLNVTFDKFLFLEAKPR